MRKELPFTPTDNDYGKFLKLLTKNKEYWKHWCIGYFNLKLKESEKKI